MSTSSTETSTEQTGDTGSGDTGDKPAPGVETGPKFTQADIDKAVQARVAAEQRRHEKALEDARADAGRSDTQRLEVERDRAVEASKAAQQKAAPRVAQALAQVAAITNGGRADRAAAIVRVADLDGVAKFDGDDWTVDEGKVAEAIGKVLDEYPEWKVDTTDAGKGDEAGKGEGGKPKPPTASGGDLNGNKGDATTLDEFARLNMGERQKLANEDPETYRRLADAEIDSKRRR